jgi:hypothetical protein
MKINKILLIFGLIGNAQLNAQYLGIGTNTPTEILHVNGNLNVSNGAIKTNGQAGAVGQVLSMNTGGNMAWANPANLTDFKNFYSIQNANTSEYATTWTVPTGVTKILVEVWGGGAGGNKSGLGGGGSGGDAGGFSRGILPVVPGQIANIILGGGGIGLGPLFNSGNSGESGHFSNLIVNSNEIQAKGGCFGCSNASIGDNFCSGCLSSYSTDGQPGIDHSDRFEQISTTDFIRNKNFGDGGSAAYTFYNTAGLGERSYINLTSNVLSIISYSTNGQVPSGGGGGCSYASPGLYACGNGGAGMIIIYY